MPFPKTYSLKKEILGIIKSNPGIKYSDLVYESIASPTSIWNELSTLRKSGEIKTVNIKDQKAKGWTLS